MSWGYLLKHATFCVKLEGTRDQNVRPLLRQARILLNAVALETASSEGQLLDPFANHSVDTFVSFVDFLKLQRAIKCHIKQPTNASVFDIITPQLGTRVP